MTQWRTWDYGYHKIAEGSSSTFSIHGSWANPLTVYGHYRTKSGDNQAFAEWHAQWVLF